MSNLELSEQQDHVELPDLAKADSINALIDLLRPVMTAITTAAGRNCEVVLHDLSHGDYNSSIVAIENGHVTNRQLGGPSTNLGLEVIAQAGNDTGNSFGYRANTADGRELRCSSIYFRNSAGTVIAALCINIDLTDLQQARHILDRNLTIPDQTEQREIFAPDIATVLDSMVNDAIDQVGAPVSQMDKPQRMQVMQLLEHRGAFIVKHSVNKVSRRLNISRVTAYAYLDELRTRQEDTAQDAPPRA